jgi:hypothetical protein
MGKFPQLAAFEAEGLLPETGTEDDPAKMEEIFGKFAGKLTSIQQQAGKSAKEEFASGGVGKAAGSGGGDADVKGASAAAALKAANDAVLKGDAKGYKENYDKYLELSKAKT